MQPEETVSRSPLYKPLHLLTEDDISQLTREDCRRFLKEKGLPLSHSLSFFLSLSFFFLHLNIIIIILIMYEHLNINLYVCTRNGGAWVSLLNDLVTVQAWEGHRGTNRRRSSRLSRLKLSSKRRRSPTTPRHPTHSTFSALKAQLACGSLSALSYRLDSYPPLY